MDHRTRDEEAQRAPDGLTRNTAAAVREALEGRRRGVALLLPLAGPAVVISVAYIDPGNIATNIQAGARYGYALLWVVLLANVIAMLFQGLSAKLGIATGRNLAELCRDSLPAPLVWLMWIVSEIAAMATDLAEFLGGAIGLALLFHLPLLAGMAVTAIPANSGMRNSNDRPMAPPRNSARSVAIAAISLTIHMSHTSGAGRVSRHSSARLRPVAMPSFAESP